MKARHGIPYQLSSTIQSQVVCYKSANIHIVIIEQRTNRSCSTTSTLQIGDSLFRTLSLLSVPCSCLQYLLALIARSSLRAFSHIVLLVLLDDVEISKIVLAGNTIASCLIKIEIEISRNGCYDLPCDDAIPRKK
jgi:hypothetical protein